MESTKNSPGINITAEEVKKKLEDLKKNGPSDVALEMQQWIKKFQSIEAKEKCLRVRFLDWLSDKFLNWSYKTSVMAANIDSPCFIEVAPRKKEESKAAKESKEILRLQEIVDRQRAENDMLLKKQPSKLMELINRGNQ